MGGRLGQLLEDIAIRLVREPVGRVALTAVVWTILLAALAFVADRLIWLGFAFGVLLPVSIWIAWKGPLLPPRGHLDYALALTPREFEELVADLIVPLGYTDIRVVGGAADLGVDVLCRDRQGRKVAIQCKRYRRSNDVSSPEVQKFIGSMVVHEADVGIIVTSSRFTAPARDLARDQGIRLIDGTELSRMLANSR